MRNVPLIMGRLMAGLLSVVVLFADVLEPNDPNQIDMSVRFSAASKQFLLGADAYGRCVLSRLLAGARYSIGLALLVIGIIGFFVTIIGIYSAYRRGVMDKLFLLTCDISMALPPTVLVLSILGVMGNGIANLLFSAVFSYWGWYGRMVRSYTLKESVKGYITYAKIGGTPAHFIMVRHLLPNVAPHLIVLLALGVGDVILMLSGFSFLGVGLPPSVPEWGAMLADSKASLTETPYVAVYPGVCVLFTVCAFNLLGEGLRITLLPQGKGAKDE